jgi:hypothetical protein
VGIDVQRSDAPATGAEPDWRSYPLFDALRQRRSRRFGRGQRMGGALAYESAREPVPLTEEEQAILAFAAAGITGPALADWDWAQGHGGNMMAGLVGRTVGSADAVAGVALIVIDDGGTWLLRRPRALTADELRAAIELVRGGDYVGAWRLLRVRIADGRCAPPVEPPYNLNANRWSLHAPGSTYFLPLADTTLLTINVLLELLGEDNGLFVLDERRWLQPAGLARFGRRKGGHLDDRPGSNNAGPLVYGDQLIAELLAVESGMMLQNLGLACQALGLGGFPHFTGHDEAWGDALGFRMGALPASRYVGAPAPVRLALRLRRQDVPIRFPLALERDGDALLQPFCPPYFASMADAVRAVVDFKLGPQGLFRGGAAAAAWRDPETVAGRIPDLSTAAVDATIALCEYVHGRYGRFPAYLPPFHTLVGFQAHHLDEDFYARYYPPEALTSTHRAHEAAWHPPAAGPAGRQGPQTP